MKLTIYTCRKGIVGLITVVLDHCRMVFPRLRNKCDSSIQQLLRFPTICRNDWNPEHACTETQQPGIKTDPLTHY